MEINLALNFFDEKKRGFDGTIVGFPFRGFRPGFEPRLGLLEDVHVNDG